MSIKSIPASYPYLSAAFALALSSYLAMGLFKSKWNPKGLHCYVTGGSSGLGLAVAKLLASKGANVSIVARDEAKLKDAVQELEKHRISPDQKFFWYSHSLTSATGSAEALASAIRPFGGAPPDAAFLCAGASKPKFFVEMSEKDLLDGMGNGYWIQAWSALELSKLYAKQDSVKGKIIFVGSTLSYMSFAGWGSYSPAKFALRGLAETLRHELQLYGATVHFLGAPTMKTPGYAEEMKTKPKLTAQIEGEEEVPVEKVASSLLKGISSGYFNITADFPTELFRASTKGGAPGNNAFFDIILLLIAAIGVPVWRMGIDKDIKAHQKEHHSYLKQNGFKGSK